LINTASFQIIFITLKQLKNQRYEDTAPQGQHQFHEAEKRVPQFSLLPD
jgi:hypothetical protein